MHQRNVDSVRENYQYPVQHVDVVHNLHHYHLIKEQDTLQHSDPICICLVCLFDGA